MNVSVLVYEECLFSVLATYLHYFCFFVALLLLSIALNSIKMWHLLAEVRRKNYVSFSDKCERIWQIVEKQELFLLNKLFLLKFVVGFFLDDVFYTQIKSLPISHRFKWPNLVLFFVLFLFV